MIGQMRTRLGVDIGGALNLVGYLVTSTSARRSSFPAVVALGYGEPVWPFLVAGAATAGFGAGRRRAHPTARSASARARATSSSRCCGCWSRSSARCRTCSPTPQLARPVDALFESMSGFSTDGRDRRHRRAGAVALDADVAAVHRLARRRRDHRRCSSRCCPRLRIGGRQALFRTEIGRAGAAAGGDDPPDRPPLHVALPRHHGGRDRGPGLLRRHGDRPAHDALQRDRGSASTIVATAGFSTEARSMEPFAPATQWVVVVFMLVAGTNFALLYVGIVRRHVRVLARDEEVRVGLAHPRPRVIDRDRRDRDRRPVRGRRRGSPRGVQHGVDDDHHRVRDRRLQPRGRR